MTLFVLSKFLLLLAIHFISVRAAHMHEIRYLKYFAHVFSFTKSFVSTFDDAQCVQLVANVCVYTYSMERWIYFRCIILLANEPVQNLTPIAVRRHSSLHRQSNRSQHIHFQIVFDELSCAHFFPFYSLNFFFL